MVDQALRERAQKKEYVAKQQRWLLFLRHCAKCQAPEGQCTYGDSCTTAKELWRHILTCADPHCQYPRCAAAAARSLAGAPHMSTTVCLDLAVAG